MGDPTLFVASLGIGAVLFVVLIVLFVRASVREERASREEPFEESKR